MCEPEVRKVIILGSTGSIGVQALEIVKKNPERFSLVGLAAGSNRDLVGKQAREFGLSPELVAIGEKEASELVSVGDCDVVLNGITGSVGLGPTMAALKSGATLALANKESLIVGGDLVLQAKKRENQIVPVDSEHSAIAQCLRSGTAAEISRLIITASGGPFKGYSPEELAKVSPEQALAHPTWDMGVVVTTNSATLVNKGLEVIEAHLLFGTPYDQIDVTVHPQSLVHSFVEFHDGSTIAQVSPPDMRLPIAMGLSWPNRIQGVIPGVDWRKSHSWSFEPIDENVFPAVSMAKEAGQEAATFPAVFNAANEQAVYAFHRREISLPDIVSCISEALNSHEPGAMTLDGVLEAERWAREFADGYIAKRRK